MRSLFPEAEVTRLLSSGLLKWRAANLQEGERVIDTNELVARRIEELEARKRTADESGFVEGLQAQRIDLEEYETPEEEKEAARNLLEQAGKDAEAVKADAEAEANQLIADARARADRILEDAKVQAQNESDQVLAKAREQGYADGMQKAEEELAAGQARLENYRAQLEAEYESRLETLEPQFVETITDIYEHIFHVELGSYREILTFLIQTTMRKIEGGRNFLIHVSKEDYPYVSLQKKQLSSAGAGAQVEIVEDMTLASNECMIETVSGIFDCGLGTQLSELSRKLKLLSYGESEL